MPVREATKKTNTAFMESFPNNKYDLVSFPTTDSHVCTPSSTPRLPKKCVEAIKCTVIKEQKGTPISLSGEL